MAAKSNGKDREPIRLTRLEVRNYQKIRAVSLLLERGLNVITSGGENGQGKSSLLNALCELFMGAGATPDDPINDETPDEDKKAQVKAWLSNGWKIELVHTEKGRYLRVKGPDGVRGNQTTLNRWVGKSAMHLGQFWKLSEEERTERILGLSPQADLLERLEDNADRHRELYDERTPHLSEVARLRKIIKKKPEGERPEPVDTSAAMARIRELQEEERARTKLAQEHNESRKAVKALHEQRVELGDEIEELERKLAAKREKAAAMDERIKAGKAHVKKLRAQFEEAPDPSEEIADLQAQVEKANEVQEALEPWREWERAKGAIEAEKEAADALTEKIKGVEAERQEILSSADIPIDGISVDTNGSLLLNGHPLSSASGAERSLLEVQAAVAENPQLRLVICDEADGIGKKKLAELGEIGERYDLDILVARIDMDGPSELEILDGEGSNLPEGWGEDEESEEDPEEEGPGEEHDDDEDGPDPEPEEDEDDDLDEAAFLLGDDDGLDDDDLELPF
jgi:hypothetical protein